MLPKPPPMSWVTKRSLSIPQRIAGAIMIAAKPGNWLLQWIVHWPVPRLYSTSAPSHSSGVELKRSKWSSEIFTMLVGLGDRVLPASPLVHAFPDEVRPGVGMDHRRVVLERGGVGDHGQRLVVDLDELGGVARELASLGDDDATGSPTKRTRPTASA